ncbi:MAG TPA: protein kinase [Candidatus Solibacter sp.]|nr:protein kinase [Candidatus Solibacter sp.]
MALPSGTKLGPYKIEAPLGAGGMGEVYRARDTRLERTVAIKILPAHLSANAEARQRFGREARTISSLNHPNICTLHDVGAQDGISYLVMEYVQGETLQVRLAKGPMPVKQAIECGMQICEALEKAHRAGIVHRDLKPGNIMLTASGAKLLDFGLAKPVAILGAAAMSDKVNLTPSTPTMNLSALNASPNLLTQQGTVVGTFQYMAPEVLQGQEADARSDLFSLGCVLYEMVTGRRAFEGKSQLSVATAILEKDPEPLTTLLPATPAALDYTVQTCLEKDPEARSQTAHDVKLQLAWVGKSGSQTSAAAMAAPKRSRMMWLVATLIAGLACAALAVILFIPRPARRVVRTNLLPPPGTIFETLYRNGPPALSPDGTKIVFVARQEGKISLWLRSLDKLEATQLRGTDQAFFPFWSPDGNSIAFFMDGKLWRMELNGGSPIAVCDAPAARGGSWGRQNVILFPPQVSGPVMQVPASGGLPKQVTKSSPTEQQLSDRWPTFLPDGKHFLFLHSFDGDASDTNEIRYASLDGGDEKDVLKGHFYTFQYVPGWLLAVRSGALMAWRFDASKGTVSGDGVQVVDRIGIDEITAMGVFSASLQGTLLYQEPSDATGDRHVWADASGKQLAQISEPKIYGPTRLSPDGTRMATPVLQGAKYPLWVWDLAGGARAPLIPGEMIVDSPVWSADGRVLYFSSIDEKDHEQVRAVPANGSEPERVLIDLNANTTPVDVTSDGKWLLHEVRKGATNEAELRAYPLAAGLQPFTVLDSVSRGSNARLRPGANDWLAYQSGTSGRLEVYVTRFPHPGAKYQISHDGGWQPVWSRDGKKLFYLDLSQKMTEVDISASGDSLQISAPKTLFQTGLRHSIPTESYDVARDGRFLLVNSIAESTAPVVLVTGWDAALGK